MPTRSLVVMSIPQTAYTSWESPWIAHCHWINTSPVLSELVSTTCKLFVMLDNPSPMMLLIPWLVLLLALVWTIVTLYFMACHRKISISFSEFRTGQHESCVAWVDAAKCTPSTSEITLAASQSKNQLQVGDLGLPVTVTGST